MPFRKEGERVVEYMVIPASERVIRTWTLAQFEVHQAKLAQQVAEFDGKAFAEKLALRKQAELDEVSAVAVSIKAEIAEALEG